MKKIITLEEDDEETWRNAKKKRVNAFMDGDEMLLITVMMIQKMKIHTKLILLGYDDNPDDEKSEVEAYDAEINEIAPDDLGEEVEPDVERMRITQMMRWIQRMKNSSASIFWFDKIYSAIL